MHKPSKINPDHRSEKTLYIAANNAIGRGYALGDVLTIIKVAEMFVQSEKPSKVLLSLFCTDPLNFLWDAFIRRYQATVIRDDWDRGNKEAQYHHWGIRFETSTVCGIHFDTYKELYPRLEGADRQGILCGGENGLGRRNIFEYYYYGQLGFQEPPPRTGFGSETFEIPCLPIKNGGVFLAPHEKCQANAEFTIQFWADVTRLLLDAGVRVNVNDQGSFLHGYEHHNFTRSFESYPRLMRQLADYSVVLCGNTGIGWAAGAMDVPLIAAERNLNLAEYSFERSDVRSLVHTVREADPVAMVDVVAEYLNSVSADHA